MDTVSIQASSVFHNDMQGNANLNVNGAISGSFLSGGMIICAGELDINGGGTSDINGALDVHGDLQ